MIVETIRKAQKGDEKSVLEMIAQFECLLTRYAHLLKYEDALNDLTLDFIVLLKQVNTSIFAGKSDGVVVNYIAQTIKHSYIRRSKQRAKVNSMETLFEDLSEGQRYHVENTNTCTNDELLGITELLSGKNLTDSERNVLIGEFCFGMSSAEIARAKSVSRQSINQIKRRAIIKLRKELGCENTGLRGNVS